MRQLRKFIQSGSWAITMLLVLIMASAVTVTFAKDLATDTMPSSAGVEEINTDKAIMGSSFYVPTEITQPTATPTLFDPDISFTWKYVQSGKQLPYLLFTPVGAEEAPTALIVWLHGSGETNASEQAFLNSGLPRLLKEWKSEGFNAYVLCPQLFGSWDTDAWMEDTVMASLQDLLDKLIPSLGVDASRVVIAGHSMGGQGALYMAMQMPEYFSRIVVLSGFNPRMDLSQISVPVIGYVGTTTSGENAASVRFMAIDFAKEFGSENCVIRDCSHSAVPDVALEEDLDGNNRSDLIEWMFPEEVLQ